MPSMLLSQMNRTQQLLLFLKKTLLWSKQSAYAYFFSATCYRNAKALPEARQAYIKAAELQHKMKSYPFSVHDFRMGNWF